MESFKNFKMKYWKLLQICFIVHSRGTARGSFSNYARDLSNILPAISNGTLEEFFLHYFPPEFSP